MRKSSPPRSRRTRVIPYQQFQQQRQRRITERITEGGDNYSLEQFMKAEDEAYLNWVLYNPSFAAQMTGDLSYCHPEMPTCMYSIRLNGQAWNVSFTTSHKCPGLRVATLVHPRLRIEIREQNPAKASAMAQAKREGAEVYQIYVDDEPVRYIRDGEFWQPEYTPKNQNRLLLKTSGS